MTRFWKGGLLPLLVVFALIAACGGGEGGPSKSFLSLGTAPPGGAFFVVGGAIAEVLNLESDAQAWEFTAEATKGSQENIRRLFAGELDLALSNSAITFAAVRGVTGWDRDYPMRTVMTLAPNVALFVTPAGSGVESLADLKGKRVVVGPAGAGFEYFLEPLLAAHGVTYEDFTPLNATQSGAVDMLSDGSAAAAFLGGAVPTASITQAATSMDLRFVPFDPDTMAQLIEEWPFFLPATIPAGTYRGLDEDYVGLNVGSMHLIASQDADEDVVYRITKTLWEQRESVVERHPAGRAINPNVAILNTGTPFHPGAQRFFEETGIWPTSEEPAEATAAEAGEEAGDGGIVEGEDPLPESEG
ncbi:MAG: TAXI family TRAP transporter solute-binding subunit [Acidobacteriota bacterium]